MGLFDSNTDWLGDLGRGISSFGEAAGNKLGDVWSGFKNFDYGGAMDKYLDPALKLGLTGTGIYTGLESAAQGREQNRILRDVEKEELRIGRPAAESGGRLTSAGETALEGGALPAPLQAQVDDQVRKDKLAIRSFLAKNGITDSTMISEMEGYADERGLVMKGQLAEQLYQEGLAGIGTAEGPLGGAGGTASRYGGQLSQATGQAFQSLALLFGSMGRGGRKPQSTSWEIVRPTETDFAEQAGP